MISPFWQKNLIFSHFSSIKPAPTSLSLLQNRNPKIKFVAFLWIFVLWTKMGRSPCCDENGVKKGPWTAEEDEKLIDYVANNGHGSWRALPKLAGLNRCGKSCRLRWTNYLRPDIKRGKFSPEEEASIIKLHSFLGNRYGEDSFRKHVCFLFCQKCFYF